MVQKENTNDSIRFRLISLLPRLRRFGAVLAGDRTGRDILLRTACRMMLGSGNQYQQGMPFDRWAFTQLYGTWLESLRDHDTPITQGKGDEELFRAAFSGAEASELEVTETAETLARLPPQQRCAVLLIYGEGFSYEEAAEILDAPSNTIIERVVRALDALIERANFMKDASAGTRGTQVRSSGSTKVESLFPRQQRAG